MKQIYEIKRVRDDVKWDEIPVLQMEYTYIHDSAHITAFGQICAGENALFVRLWANQSEIRAEEYGIDGAPYLDSCLEFFFRPEENDPRYLNFEFNLNKCLYLGVGVDLESRQRILLEDREEIFKPITGRTEKGWEVTYQIPYSFIQQYFPEFCITEGKVIWGNCYTCADLAEKPYYRSWNQVDENAFTFHCPEHFGKMIVGNADIFCGQNSEILL